MPFAPRVLALAFLPLLSRALAAQDNPEEILKPSVVAIRNDECAGTGMFLDDSGLILTNAHVACSPLPFRVHALATVKGDLKEVVFRKVTLVGFHHEYDLALLKIEPAEHDAKVKPVTAAPGHPAVRERVWAMGFPGDHDHGRSKVLTWGEVRSTNRDFYGDRYYELDISINHGNSGGPLTNGKGEVLGVVTILVSAGALAIPIEAAKADRFGPLKERAPNRTISLRLITEAEQLLQRASDGSSIPQALTLYREALLWDAGNAGLYGKVGKFYLAARRHDAAAAYLARSVQLQPWPETPEVYLDLGLAFAGLRKEEEARAAWGEGAQKFPLDNSALWGAMGAALEKSRHYFESACCARIALHTFSDQSADLNALYQRVEGKLSAEESGKLRDLETGINNHLTRLGAEAERARREGRIYMTPEAEKLIGAFDGVQQETPRGGGPPPLPVRQDARTPAPAPPLGDAELDARFVQVRFEVAKEHVRAGRKEKAIEILEDVVRSYPKHPEAERARLLLQLLRKS
jgi:tetratricopeptide (TPR) repeat protein